MSVGGHQMTRAEKLSLPQLYNQYFHIAYYIGRGFKTLNQKPKPRSRNEFGMTQKRAAL